MTLLKKLQADVRKEWKCTCDDCGHINEMYDMDDLCELLEDTAKAIYEDMLEQEFTGECQWENCAGGRYGEKHSLEHFDTKDYTQEQLKKMI